MNCAGLVTVGRLGRPHGLHGAVRVWPMGLPVDRLARIGRLILEGGEGDRCAVVVRRARVVGRGFYVEFEGVADRTAVERLCGKFLVVPREDLPPLEAGEYYSGDLVGLVAENAAGDRLGVVAGVEPGAAHDLLVIERTGRLHRVPAVRAFVREVDLSGRRIVIEEIDGLWE